MKSVLFLALAVLASPVLAETVEPLTTVILVRHAEKASDTDDDSPLSDAGHARARELARVLAATPIDVIYTTQWVRTRATAAPLAEALGVKANVFPTSRTYAADLAKHIRASHKGGTVLVVGHSNSTIDVLRHLGVSDPKPIPDSQYDDLFICTISGDEVKMIPLRYGTPTRSPMKDAPRFLALGDSYTIGEAVGESERWPVVLAKKLGTAAPVIIARTGWTTDELSTAIDAAKPAGPFDLVTLLIGVNNQYRGRDAQQYRTEFARLLGRAVAFADGDARRVVVVSIPDWGVTPFAAERDRARIASEIDRFNAINREETARAGARYADITAISRRAGTDASLNAGDGLHPSAVMYRLWVDVILSEARVALSGG